MKMNNSEKLHETPSKFIGRFNKDGGLDFGTYTRMNLKRYIKDNPNMSFELKPLLPESNKQRGFFEGGICPLIAYYQEGLDHRNSKDIQKVREWLKIEFNGEMVVINKKAIKIAQSTKRKLNDGFLEKVINYIEQNYAPPQEALNGTDYEDWKNRIYPYGGPDNYIDYLHEIKKCL